MTERSTARLVVCAAALLLGAATAGAGVLLLGSDIPINETTAGGQFGARAHAVGGARDQTVVAWQSDDGDGTGVFARHFDSGGFGSEFPVNTSTAGAQGRAAVAVAETQGFVIAWSSSVGDGDVYGIVAQRYDASGAPQGTEFIVNSYTTAGQDAPSVAMAADGSFLVVWESFTQDGDQSAVAGRVFDASGVALGSDFVINTYTTGAQLEPSAVALANGGFAVAWESQGQDGDGYGVIARTLDADGTPSSSEIAVNAYTTGEQRDVHVGARAGGNFVVTWAGNADGDADGISARLVDDTGTPQGADMAINEYVTGGQARAAVAGQGDGSFVVVWDSLGQDGDGYGVFGRRFESSGVADGTEFQVNSYTTGFQGYTNSIASDGAGGYVVAWADGMQDGDGFGMFGLGLCTDADDDGDCDLRCDIEPATGCLQAAAGKSSISIKDNVDDAKDQVKWKWAKGDLTPLEAFLNPLGSTADYRFCIYDESGERQPLLEAALAPGGQCDDAPCWKAVGTKGFSFSDRAAAQDGIAKVKLKSGEAGKAQVQIAAEGLALDTPAPPLTGNVTVQFIASDSMSANCWQTVYTAPKKNEAGNNVASYKAKGP